MIFMLQSSDKNIPGWADIYRKLTKFSTVKKVNVKQIGFVSNLCVKQVKQCQSVKCGVKRQQMSNIFDHLIIINLSDLCFGLC